MKCFSAVAIVSWLAAVVPGASVTGFETLVLKDGQRITGLIGCAG